MTDRITADLNRGLDMVEKAVRVNIPDRLRAAAELLDRMGLEPIAVSMECYDKKTRVQLKLEDFKAAFGGEPLPYEDIGGQRHYSKSDEDIEFVTLDRVPAKRGMVTL